MKYFTAGFSLLPLSCCTDPFKMMVCPPELPSPQPPYSRHVETALVSLYLIYRRRSNASYIHPELGVMFTSTVKVLHYMLLLCVSGAMFPADSPHSSFCVCMRIE